MEQDAQRRMLARLVEWLDKGEVLIENIERRHVPGERQEFWRITVAPPRMPPEKREPVACNRCRFLLELGGGDYGCKAHTVKTKHWLYGIENQICNPKEINKNCDCAQFEEGEVA